MDSRFNRLRPIIVSWTFLLFCVSTPTQNTIIVRLVVMMTRIGSFNLPTYSILRFNHTSIVFAAKNSENDSTRPAEVCEIKARLVLTENTQKKLCIKNLNQTDIAWPSAETC